MIDLKNYIIAIVVFTFVIVGGVSIMGIWFTDNTAITSDEKYIAFNQTFNKLDDVTSSIESLQSRVDDTEPEKDILGGVLGGLINSAWNGLKLIFSSFGFMTEGFEGLSTIFGVPAWIPVLIGLMVIVTIVFAIWSAFFKA